MSQRQLNAFANYSSKRCGSAAPRLTQYCYYYYAVDYAMARQHTLSLSLWNGWLNAFANQSQTFRGGGDVVCPADLSSAIVAAAVGALP